MAFGIDFNTLLPIVVVLFIVYFIVVIIARFVAPMSPLLQALLGRRKPIDQQRDNYHALVVHDLKRGAKRNRVPARVLKIKDPKDPEHPWIFYGKIKGVTMETDVCHILLKFRSISPFSQLLFIQPEYLTDVLSKELYAECAGFVPRAKYFWLPVWGSNVDKAERVRRNEQLRIHVGALFLENLNFYILEETSAQAIAGMEPKLKSGREPVAREGRPMAVEETKGEEAIE